MFTPNVRNPSGSVPDADAAPRAGNLDKALLLCGLLAALLYVGSDIIAAMRWADYSYTAQSVSELRAIGAPTRAFLMPILLVYTLLEIAFGFGVWRAAGHKRSLHIAGALLIGLGILELAAPNFQLNLNEPPSSLTNRIHLILAAATVVVLFLVLAFGSTAGGKWFRIYTILTIAAFLIFGIWTFMDVPRIEANLPTPWLGIKERVNIYGYMLWLVVASIVLLRKQAHTAADRPSAGFGPPQLTPR